MKFVCSYSGGKDSTLALYRAIQAGHEPVALLVTCDKENERSWFHNIPYALMKDAAQALKIPLLRVETEGERYAGDFEQALIECGKMGAGMCVFGDIDIQEHYDWCDARCKNAGMESFFPLWQQLRQEVVAAFLEAGFQALITVVNTDSMDESYVGQTLCKALVSKMAAEGVDVCGEMGEYHTFVYDGPLFSRPVPFVMEPPEKKNKHVRVALLKEGNIGWQVSPLDEKAMDAAKSRLDSLIKPLRSLGQIEDLAVQLAGITGDVYGDYEKKAIIVFCADNGVYEEGVSAAPQAVTLTQTLNIQKGITGVGILSKMAGNDLVVVDVGVKSDVPSTGVVHRKIRKGTSNLAKMPAMSRAEAERAIRIGFDEVRKLHEAGYKVVGTGEMGLGNTTTAALTIMALTGCSLEEAVGKGAGLSPEAFAHKKQVIQTAFSLHSPNPKDPIDVLSKVGGFDIAAMAGAFIGAACYRMPVVIDGVISLAAALCAHRLCANARCYMIPSHKSKEPGYLPAMNALGFEPYFHLGMRLGEGSGCPFAFMLIDAALRVMKEMATFKEGAVQNDFLAGLSQTGEEDAKQ